MKLFLCYPKQKKCLSEGLKKGVKKGDEDICHRKCVSKEGRIKPAHNAFTGKLWTEADDRGCSSN